MIPYLPIEILHYIFSLLRPNLRRRGYGPSFNEVAPSDLAEESARQLALSHISRSSRLFRQLALPVLYHTIPATSPQLLDTLSKHEYIAEMVKAIDLTSAAIPRDALRSAFEVARPRLSISSDLVDHLSLCIESTLPQTGAEDAMYLFLLPNLETLEYCIDTAVDSIVVSYFEWMSQCDRVYQLRQLRLHHRDAQYAIHISNFEEILVPTIEILHGCGVSWEINPYKRSRPFLPPPYMLPERLGLQHIELVDAMINSVGLTDLLSRCPNLHSLYIAWSGATQMPAFPLDFTAMGVAIRDHTQQLEKLVLDHPRYKGANSIGRLGSLRTLMKLKAITLPQDMLVGDTGSADQEHEVNKEEPLPLSQVLPDSLEYLCLLTCHGDREDLDEQVCSLITDGRLPNLRKIQMKRGEVFSRNAADLGWTLWHDGDKMTLRRCV
ncbi:hypothetical protein F5Y04DRAFT_173436 [Hypomontagnella monticulosa]|nr:hypothetical protein F5Y04DRAFT_173436 [Hypomontagnella monticulosa]